MGSPVEVQSAYGYPCRRPLGRLEAPRCFRCPCGDQTENRKRKKGTAVTATYSNLPNKLVSAANGIDYAYRDAGDGAVPLVLLQHFRGAGINPARRDIR